MAKRRRSGRILSVSLAVVLSMSLLSGVAYAAPGDDFPESGGGSSVGPPATGNQNLAILGASSAIYLHDGSVVTDSSLIKTQGTISSTEISGTEIYAADIGSWNTDSKAGESGVVLFNTSSGGHASDKVKIGGTADVFSTDYGSFNTVITLDDKDGEDENTLNTGSIINDPSTADETFLGAGIAVSANALTVQNTLVEVAGYRREALAALDSATTSDGELSAKVIVEDSTFVTHGSRGQGAAVPAFTTLLGSARAVLLNASADANFFNSEFYTADWATYSLDQCSGVTDSIINCLNINRYGGYGVYAIGADNEVDLYGSTSISAQYGSIVNASGTMKVYPLSTALSNSSLMADYDGTITSADAINTGGRTKIIGLTNAMSFMCDVSGASVVSTFEAHDAYFSTLYEDAVLSDGTQMQSATQNQDWLTGNSETDSGAAYFFMNYIDGDPFCFRSANSTMSLDGCEVASRNGNLIHTVIGFDLMSSGIHPSDTNSSSYAGYDITLSNMDAEGDILAEDYQRKTQITLDNTDLSGAVVTGTMASWNSGITDYINGLWNTYDPAVCDGTSYGTIGQAAEADGSTAAGAAAQLIVDSSYNVFHGVELSLKGGSTWTVTGDSSVASLTVESGSSIAAPAGSSIEIYTGVTMNNSCDGFDVSTGTKVESLSAGTYQNVVILVEEEPSELTGLTTFIFDDDTVTVIEGESDNWEITIYGDDDDDEDAPCTVNSDGNKVYYIPDDYAQTSGKDNFELQVGLKKKGGTYVVEGEGTGSIAIKKEATAPTTVYLNGLTLESGITAPIVVKKDSESYAVISAVEGTVNTLTDNEYNNDDNHPENEAGEKAVMKFKDGSDVRITGSGTINIKGNAKNGIKANNLLTIEDDVVLNIDTVDNGISCDNLLTINSGTLNVTTADGDGIKACADDLEQGSITVNGGDFTIRACGDAFQAMVNLTITGGTFDIMTYDGWDTEGYDKDDDENWNSAKGLKASGSYEVDGVEIDAESCQLTVTGGIFNINTADDSVHSDNGVSLIGGDFVIRSGDDGIHADYTNAIGDPDNYGVGPAIDIEESYEGIEGATVNIYGGDLTVNSSDDSINGANSDLTGFNYTINVYGGNIYAAAAEGDCLDSNGDINVYGGTIVALGALNLDEEGGGNNALDCDGTLTVSGDSTILGIGQSDQAKNPTGDSNNYVTWSAAGGSTAVTPSSSSQGGMGQGGTAFIYNGDIVTVYDSDYNELMTVKCSWNTNSITSEVNYVQYTTQDVVSGNTYYLAIDDSERPDNGIIKDETVSSGNQGMGQGGSNAEFILRAIDEDGNGHSDAAVVPDDAWTITSNTTGGGMGQQQSTTYTLTFSFTMADGYNLLDVYADDGKLDGPDADGVYTYTVTVSGQQGGMGGQQQQSTTHTIYLLVESTQVHVHEYDFDNITWNASGDYTGASATVYCGDEDCEDPAYTVNCMISTETVESGCTTPGSVTYIATADFTEIGGGVYTHTLGQTAIDPTGHEYDYSNITWSWADDCSRAAATVKCLVCGETDTVNATVTSETDEDGNITYTATITDELGNTYTDTQTVEAGEKTPPVTHEHTYVFKEWIDVTTATALFDCVDGDDPVTVTGTVSESVVPATCTETGEITYTATASYKGVQADPAGWTETIAALGHDWGDWTVDTPATCTEDGAESRSCSRCGETESIVLPATGHNWVQVSEEVIGGTDSYTIRITFECMNCHETYEDDVVTETLSEGVEVHASFSWSDIIGESELADLFAEHEDIETVDIAVTAADINGAVSEEDEELTIGQAGEIFGEVTGIYYMDIGINLSVTIDEEEVYSVSVGQTVNPIEITVVIPEELRALDGDYVVVRIHEGEVSYIVPAYVDEESLTFESDLFSTYAIVKGINSEEHLVHEWDDGVLSKEPTCTDRGEITYTCEICGATLTEYIDALGHDWDEGVITREPTETEEGEITYTCSRCGETYTESIPALGTGDTGDKDTGDKDTGIEDTGDEDTGDKDTGIEDTGDEDTGDEDTGDENTGDKDTGIEDTGDKDTGDKDTGDKDTGIEDTGDEDTGDEDTGDEDTGDEEPGDENTGDKNSGDEGGDDNGGGDTGSTDSGDTDSVDSGTVEAAATADASTPYLYLTLLLLAGAAIVALGVRRRTAK